MVVEHVALLVKPFAVVILMRTSVAERDLLGGTLATSGLVCAQ